MGDRIASTIEWHSHPYLLALATAILLAFSTSCAFAAPLSLVALVPWWIAIRAASCRETAWTGLFVGTAYGCFVALWIPEALRTLDASWLYSVTGLVTTAMWAKVPIFMPVGLVAFFVRERGCAERCLAVGATFLGLEWLASTWSLGVPWALLGHAQLPLLGVAQLAVVGGVPLVSAAIAAVNVALAGAIAGDAGAWRLAVAGGSAWVTLAAFGLPLAEWARPEASTKEPRHRLLVVQPDIPRGERWGEALQPLNLKRVKRFVARLEAEDVAEAEALVLPENLLTAPVDASPDLAGDLQGWVNELGVPLISGLALSPEALDPSLYRSAAVWLEPGASGFKRRVDKVRAVPVVEAEGGWLAKMAGRLFGDAAAWKKVEQAREAGPLTGEFEVAAVLCYEALFPGLVSARRTPETVAILNLADGGWVAGDEATQQLTDFATWRAIEQRLPLIRVAHGGLSVVVDPFGRRTESLPLDTYAATTVSVRALPPPTLGERTVILLLPGAVGCVVWWCTGLIARRREAS